MRRKTRVFGMLTATSLAALALSGCATTTNGDAMGGGTTDGNYDEVSTNAPFDFPPASAATPMGQGHPFSGVDPDSANQAILDALMAQGLRPYHTLEPAAAREQPTFDDGDRKSVL